MKASDIYPTIRRSHFSIPELDKAYLGKFDPKVGFTGEGAAPRGYHPGTGKVHETGQERSASPEEREKMLPGTGKKLDIAAQHVAFEPRIRIPATGQKMKEAAEKAMKEKVIGGIGDNKPDSDFDPEQLAAGIKVEMEHTKDKSIAKEIAKDHITEDKNYYVKLKKMESSNKSLAMLADMISKAEPGNTPKPRKISVVGTSGKELLSGETHKKEAAPESKKETKPAPKKAPSELPAKHSGTGTSMTAPSNYSGGYSMSGGHGGYGMSSTAPSSAASSSDKPKYGAIDAEFEEVKPKTSATIGSAPTPVAPKMLPAHAGSSVGGAPPGSPAASKPVASKPAAGVAPSPAWPKPGAAATGSAIVPRMTSTTGGPGTLHPGPAAPSAETAGGVGSGKPGGPGKPGEGKAAKQKTQKLPGSAFGEGMGIGGAAASDVGSPAGGAAPIQTALGFLGQKADVRSWRAAGSAPVPAGQTTGSQSLGRSGQLRMPSLKMSISKSGPMLYLRKGL